MPLATAGSSSTWRARPLPTQALRAATRRSSYPLFTQVRGRGILRTSTPKHLLCRFHFSGQGKHSDPEHDEEQVAGEQQFRAGVTEGEQVGVVAGEDQRRGKACRQEECADDGTHESSRAQGHEGQEPDQVLRRENPGAEHERKYKRSRMPRKCPDPEPAAPAKLPPHREPRNGQQQKGEQRAEGGRKTYALAPKLESAVLEDDAVHRAEEHQDRRRDALHL